MRGGEAVEHGGPATGARGSAGRAKGEQEVADEAVEGVEGALLEDAHAGDGEAAHLDGLLRGAGRALGLHGADPPRHRVVVFAAVVFTLVNLAVDLLYGFLNPKVQYG